MRRPVAALLLLALAGPAAAEEASLSASVTADEITADQTIQLTIALSRDAAQPYHGYQKPSFADWDVLHQAQAEQTQWAITNGRQTVRTIEQHIYVLRPKHRGICAIPPATARIGGKELRSQALTVRVTAAPKRPALAEPAPPPGLLPVPEPPAGPGGDDLFVDGRLDKTTVHVGEQILATWTLYTQTDILRYRAATEPRHDDFWSEDLLTPPPTLGWTRQTVGGQDYQAAPILKKALFPIKAGRLTITPLEVEATTMETMFYAGASAVRAARPLVVEVLPLPAAGRPGGFAPQNVGRYSFAAQADRTELRAGEALTYKLILRGDGNLRQIKPRRIDSLPGFKIYEPTVSERVERGDVIRGEKVVTYLLQPNRGGELTVPPQEFPYFDPTEKRYVVARTEAITVRVAGDPGQLGSGPGKENVLGERIRPLRPVKGVRSRVGERVVRGPLLWVGLAAPPSLLLLLVLARSLGRTLLRDTPRSRRRWARRAARRRLREAELHLRGARPAPFFSACNRAIYDLLELRLGIKGEALTFDELQRRLVERGCPPETADALARELEQCDFARFAPSASGPGEMRAALRRVEELVAAVDRLPMAREERP